MLKHLLGKGIETAMLVHELTLLILMVILGQKVIVGITDNSEEIYVLVWAGNVEVRENLFVKADIASHDAFKSSLLATQKRRACP